MRPSRIRIVLRQSSDCMTANSDLESQSVQGLHTCICLERMRKTTKILGHCGRNAGLRFQRTIYVHWSVHIDPAPLVAVK
jgi:hypothetical protein